MPPHLGVARSWRRRALRVAAALVLLGARCEALTKPEHRARKPAREEQMSGLVSTPAVGDAKDTVGTGALDHTSARVQKLFTLAARMTEDNWLRGGGEGAQALKARFVKSSVVRAKVAERCQGAAEGADCAWRQEDALLCELLQLAGGGGGLGDLKILENAIVAHAGSTGYLGVDWTGRAAMIARWKDQIRVPKPPGAAEFSGMRRRALANRYLERLVNRTCQDLASLRPRCRADAEDALFCEALAQASTVAVGTDSGHKVVLAKMEDLVPRAQGLLGSSPLRRQEAVGALPRQLAEDGRPEFDAAQEEWEQRNRERQQDVAEASWDAAPRLPAPGAPARSAEGGAPAGP